jgi:hypothetical protein
MQVVFGEVKCRFVCTKTEGCEDLQNGKCYNAEKLCKHARIVSDYEMHGNPQPKEVPENCDQCGASVSFDTLKDTFCRECGKPLKDIPFGEKGTVADCHNQIIKDATAKIRGDQTGMEGGEK